MSKDILSIIQTNMNTFSKGQKLIGRFILDSYDKAAFMTASKLGKTVNVSESTVVRFAAELGYDGYPAMQKALQEMIRNKLTSIQRIEVSNDRIGNQDILSMVMQSDVEKIRMTLEEVDRDSFDRAVDAIVSARRIYILGVRSASAIASFLAFYFNLIFEDVVHIHSTSVSEVFEQLLRIGPRDVIIGISFPRYSRRTVKAMEFARDRGAQVVAITDSETSPLTAIATHTLMAKSDMASFVDSLVAPLSLVNALIVALGRRKNSDLSETFGVLEKIWDEYEVYEKVEDSF
ncbi:MurR/RpiR family transcriptional regulator [Pseudoflavonifractor sp. DSM 107456]|uniref:MurR/RpiR family transcriptional regulator n=2 Tax=Pseudoflavonifractor TaxID=1017280 RepID=A0ABR9R9J1_9FIRM|nr:MULTISPECIES: MurR/RpiR family transcriptional regulator [Pseudoflavonifractor]MBC5731036.1 MurR/RpiR family transcriptional regulator [Pseudoflavonifractor hominis]MBE5055352.1 MurR/RpiR family transcriptional regulator [Pseudoflavonifractor gallinarum]MBS5135181.1 MurR/RpiR family transcriptional regulator [Oscillospiraceae bacterium]